MSEHEYPSFTNIPTQVPSEEIRRFGKYVLVRKLGQGGMGEVWLARDTVADIDVALKFLPPELQHNREEQERLKGSFRLVEKLQHPAICRLRDLQLDPEVGFFLVMDYFDGVTLSQYRSAYVKQRGTQFPLSQVIRLLTPVAQALDYAHSEKIVHRDIKPANILVSRDCKQIRIIDFQLAWEIRATLSRISQKQPDTSGTYPYMAPELWLGARANPSTDQYALAMVAYELLAGHLPYEAGDMSMWKEIVTNPQAQVPAIDDVSEEVLHSLSQVLSRNLKQRASSCENFVQQLSGQAIEVVSPPPPPPLPRPSVGPAFAPRLTEAPPLVIAPNQNERPSTPVSHVNSGKIATFKLFKELTTLTRKFRSQNWLSTQWRRTMFYLPVFIITGWIAIITFMNATWNRTYLSYDNFNKGANKIPLNVDETLLLQWIQETHRFISIEGDNEYYYGSSSTRPLLSDEDLWSLTSKEFPDIDRLYGGDLIIKPSVSLSMSTEVAPKKAEQLAAATKRLKELKAATVSLSDKAKAFKTALNSSTYWWYMKLGGSIAAIFAGLSGFFVFRWLRSTRANLTERCRLELNQIVGSNQQTLLQLVGSTELDDKLVRQSACNELATREHLEQAAYDRMKLLTGLTGFFLGALGLHKFVTGRHSAGLIQLSISMTLFGMFVTVPLGIIEAIITFCMPVKRFYSDIVIGDREWF